MWTRQELKARGKVAFKANYWKCVLVAFLASILTATGTSYSGKQQVENISNGNGPAVPAVDQNLAVIAIIGGAVILLILFVIAIDILLVNPLIVGCNNFFLKNRRDSSTNLDTLEIGFKKNWKNNVVVMFMTQLVTFLWTLLLIVPGIIKSYSYRLVPYILAENPGINYKDAMAESNRLMYGHKKNAFVLDLSFIGWVLLGVFTLGLLNIFYVNPYIEATNAELYIALAHADEKENIQAVADGAQTVEFEVTE